MSAISAAAMRVRTMADGSLRIEVEVEPADAQAAFALFGRPGAPMALAALVEGHAAVREPEAEKPKGGERAKLAARLGQSADFRQWMLDTFPSTAAKAPPDMTDTQAAAFMVRQICGVKSRADLDTDKAAGNRFDTAIRLAWLARSGVTA